MRTTLVVLIALVVLSFGGYYYYKTQMRPVDVKFINGNRLAFDVPNGWCASNDYIASNTVTIYKRPCKEMGILPRGLETVVTVRALVLGDPTTQDDLATWHQCVDGNVNGVNRVQDGQATYCERSADAQGIRVTWVFKMLDAKHMSVTIISMDESESYFGQKGNLTNLVNSYKLVSAI